MEHNPHKISEDQEMLTREIKLKNKLCYLSIALVFGLISISEISVQFLLKDELKLEPVTLSIILSSTNIPWLIKPLFGFLTDLYPIFGYRRKIYIIITSLTQSICWILLSLVVKNIYYIFSLLLIANAGLSFLTVLGEAIVVELSRMEKDQEKISILSKNYVSMFFLIKTFGGLMASYLKGALLEIITIRSIFLLTSMIPLLSLLGGMIFIEGKVVCKEGNNQEQVKFYLENLEEPKLEFTTETPNQIQIIKNSHISENDFSKINGLEKLFIFFRFVFQKKILIPSLFIVFYFSPPSYINNLFYFQTNILKFKPEQLGKISFFSNLAYLLAIFAYRKFFKNLKFQKIILICTILTSVFNLFCYILVKRWNVGYIGDFWLSLATNVVTSGLSEMIIMPILALSCELCPKNYEGSVYSFFMSSLNLGFNLGNFNGSIVTHFLHITSKNFENLPLMILITNMCMILPLILFIFIDENYFNPRRTQNDDNANK